MTDAWCVDACMHIFRSTAMKILCKILSEAPSWKHQITEHAACPLQASVLVDCIFILNSYITQLRTQVTHSSIIITTVPSIAHALPMDYINCHQFGGWITIHVS